LFADEVRRVDEHGNALAQARDASAAGDWPTAAARFDAVADGELIADDLLAYFEAVWWVGRSDDALRVGAAAYDALAADSRPAQAAKIAYWLTLLYASRGDEPQAYGWAGRAGRVLEGVPENPGHGYLLLLTEVQLNLQTGEPSAAVDAARRVQELGREFDDPDLVAAGLYGQGSALIKLGQVTDGLALIDEAMVGVLDGRVASLLAGALYCNAIGACHEVADMRRMTLWTEATEQWLASLSAVVDYYGMCRVYRAELQLLRGAWDEAERGAHQSAVELDGKQVPYAAEAWYVVGEVRRLRGDPTAADAYDEARARGRDPQPGRALLQLQHGDAAGAATSIRSALAAVGADRLRRAPICAVGVEVALAAGLLEDAADYESELAETAATFATSGFEAMAATARGAVLLAQDRATDALPVLRDASRRWLDLGAEYDAASSRRWLAEAYRALGDDTSAVAERAQADKTYERLGAQPTERPGAQQPGPQPSGGLTGRECEVLTLVAEGHSNRQIGEELFISEYTVARHLANIYLKLEITNRTEAARYALKHGIAISPR
jgi:DNA-binding NarL/FixJ family response regulator